MAMSGYLGIPGLHSEHLAVLQIDDHNQEICKGRPGPMDCSRYT